MKTTGLISLILLSSILSVAQCNKNYMEVIDTNNCKIISMSKAKFTLYYQISKEVDVKSIENRREERRKMLKNDSLLNKRVIIESRRAIEAHESLYDCIDENIIVEVENEKLKTKIKKRNKFIFFQNLGLTGIILVLILL